MHEYCVSLFSFGQSEGQRRWEKYPRKCGKIGWACIEGRRRICGQESDGDGGKDGKEDRSVSGWITSGIVSRRPS